MNLSTLPSQEATGYRSELTLIRKEFDGTKEPVGFFCDYNDGWLHVPKGWILTGGLPPWHRPSYHDNRSDGRPLPPGTRAHVTFGQPPFPVGQPQFIDRIVLETQRNQHGGLCIAPTRAGKTLCSLEAACRLGRSTLIIVDNGELMNQWRHEVEKHLRVPCGIIRQQQFETDKPFTVAMAQTLVHRQLSEEHRRAWGTVIVDEADIAPAHTYWTALTRLHARYVLGLSATPDRADGLGEAIRWIIGPPLAHLERKLNADVHFLPFMWTYEGSIRQWNKTSWVRVEQAAMDDVSRVNRLAFEAARASPDRRVLMMVGLVEHAERLAEAVRAHGVEVGMFLGSADKREMRYPVVLSTYKKAKKGIDFKPPPTLFIPAGPRRDIRQACGRALQPQADCRTLILHPVDMIKELIVWAEACAAYYAEQGFVFRNYIDRSMAA